MTEQSKKIEAPNVQRHLGKHAENQSAKVMKLWRHRPKIFFRDVMDVTMDLWQEECVDLYMNNQRVGLIASKGPGKTFMLAGMCWHFCITNHSPKVACLSITKDHLKSNFWAELLRLRAQSPLLAATFEEGMSRMNCIGREGYSFIDARSFPKQADENQQASALAGLHADNVAFFIDEAGMIPDAVIATADAALTTEEGAMKKAKLICTANPEEPRGILYRAAMGRSLQDWKIYRVSGDPDDPKRAPRVSLKWAQEQIDMYGRDNPWVMVNVLGQYPPSGTTKLISEEEVYQAMNREIIDKEVRNSQLRLGADIARGGVDNTVFAKRRGLKAYPLEVMASDLDGPQLASKLAFLHQDERVERVFVDNTGGYGSSVIDSLKMFPQMDVTPVVYNAKAQDDRYYNKRTEMWVRMRDWIKEGGCLPNDPQLADEIQMPNIMFHGGKMRLEEKEQIKSRLGRSPDRADALAQTFADVEQASFYADYSDSFSPIPGQPHGRGGNYLSSQDQLDNKYRPPSNYKS